MPVLTVTSPQGFQAAGVACGIKPRGKLDLGLLVADRPCTAAAVFTRNRFCGAPVTVGRAHVADAKLRAIVVNSGCSNVATGKRGVRDAHAMCGHAASLLEAAPEEVLPSSTGVIGEYLPMEKIREGIDMAMRRLDHSEAAGKRFARAILTTDTKIKMAAESVKIGKQVITVAGCAKGSGMIAPNMATMLGYITTDAKVPGRTLQRMLREAVEPTFNRVTVDECESTSDTVAMMASGLAGALSTKNASHSFASALYDVCDSLAYQIVQDGEGATRVLEVIVSGAKTPGEAHAAARAVAVSPLVKTAVHGGDPNWGRIIQALGTTDVQFNPDRVTVDLGDRRIFAQGGAVRTVKETDLAKRMRAKHVTFVINLHAGKAGDRVLTCDLSHAYVTINADYRT